MSEITKVLFFNENSLGYIIRFIDSHIVNIGFENIKIHKGAWITLIKKVLQLIKLDLLPSTKNIIKKLFHNINSQEYNSLPTIIKSTIGKKIIESCNLIPDKIKNGNIEDNNNNNNYIYPYEEIVISNDNNITPNNNNKVKFINVDPEGLVCLIMASIKQDEYEGTFEIISIKEKYIKNIDIFLENIENKEYDIDTRISMKNYLVYYLFLDTFNTTKSKAVDLTLLSKNLLDRCSTILEDVFGEYIDDKDLKNIPIDCMEFLYPYIEPLK
jgi:hypothetical protein